MIHILLVFEKQNGEVTILIFKSHFDLETQMITPLFLHSVEENHDDRLLHGSPPYCGRRGRISIHLNTVPSTHPTVLLTAR